MIKTKQKTYQQHIGFTLIEVLVVVTILIILTAILVPRLRMITQERNIREASRVVGSMFAQASQRGVTDGISGVILLRNPNFVDSSGFRYASTQIGLLRKVPDYRGDSDTAIASFASGTVSIPKPLEQDELDIVLVGDLISFSSSKIRYEITGVSNTDPMQLTLGEINAAGRQGYLPSPSLFISGGGIDFTIHRTPRLLRSSLTDLPKGHFIDLRFSGCNNSAGNSLVNDGELNRPLDVAPDVRDVVLLVDNQGKFDRMLFVTTGSVEQTRLPIGPFYAFVTAGETDLTVNPLSKDTNLWVSMSNTSGIINVGYNVAQDVALTTINNAAANKVNVNNARSLSNLGSAAQ